MGNQHRFELLERENVYLMIGLLLLRNLLLSMGRTQRIIAAMNNICIVATPIKQSACNKSMELPEEEEEEEEVDEEEVEEEEEEEGRKVHFFFFTTQIAEMQKKLKHFPSGLIYYLIKMRLSSSLIMHTLFYLEK